MTAPKPRQPKPPTRPVTPPPPKKPRTKRVARYVEALIGTRPMSRGPVDRSASFGRRYLASLIGAPRPQGRGDKS